MTPATTEPLRPREMRSGGVSLGNLERVGELTDVVVVEAIIWSDFLDGDNATEDGSQVIEAGAVVSADWLAILAV